MARELYAIREAVKSLEPRLFNQEIILYTDHQNLMKAWESDHHTTPLIHRLISEGHPPTKSDGNGCQERTREYGKWIN